MNKDRIVEFPPSIAYEAVFASMPWGETIEDIIHKVVAAAPVNGLVLDLMCGPGYLLGKIAEQRPDLALIGVDNNKEFISYGKSRYHFIHFFHADVLKWSCEQVDVLLCTGGLHHLPYADQPEFLKHCSGLLKQNGVAYFADPYVEEYSNALERRLAVAKLGSAYLLETIKRGAPDEVVQEAIRILHDDIQEKEYKLSLQKGVTLFKQFFRSVTYTCLWPHEISHYGDYVFTCIDKE